MDDAPLIAIEKASFGYDGEPVLRDLSLAVPVGDFIGIVGPNGAGKTTLFRGILGLIPPLSGTVRRAAGLARRIGYVPQRDQLDPIYPLMARDVVAMGITGVQPWYRFPGRAAALAVRVALERVGIEAFANHAFTELSGGQRQRVLIARALAAQPALLVLDEPTAGIDPAAEESILRLLTDLNQREAITILMVSHHLHALRARVRRAIVVDNQSIRVGSSAEILRASAGGVPE